MVEISSQESRAARLLLAALRAGGAWLAEAALEALRHRTQRRAAALRRRALDGLSERLQRDAGLAEAEIARGQAERERLRRQLEWPRPWC